MGQKVKRCDWRRVGGRHFHGPQVLIYVGLECDLATVNELHDGGGGKELGYGSNGEDGGSGNDLLPGIEICGAISFFKSNSPALNQDKRGAWNVLVRHTSSHYRVD